MNDFNQKNNDLEQENDRIVNSSDTTFEDTDFTHAVDVAEHLEGLSLEEQVSVVRNLSAEEAAGAIAELDEELAGDLLENLELDEASAILAEMEPDDAADVLDEVDEVHRDKILDNLDVEDAADIRLLMTFDPDTAGGIMNTETITLRDTLTADEAISQIRQEMEDKETPYYGYVVDDTGVILGVLSLRELMLSPPGKILHSCLHEQEFITVPFDMPNQEVARLFSRYDFMAMPVVDEKNHLLGIITYDDILDVIEDEASSDMLGMVGASPDETVDTPWKESVRMRLPWLLLNLLNSTLSASVVYLFEGSIATMAILAVLMPIVANQAGNTGQQALAVMIRQLALEKFESRKAWLAVLREAKIGLSSGIVMGVCACLGAWLFSGIPTLGIVMGAALMCDMLLGALAGGSIPLILRWLGRDPAHASSIFLTAITDAMGFFIFLGLATTFLF